MRGQIAQQPRWPARRLPLGAAVDEVGRRVAIGVGQALKVEVADLGRAALNRLERPRVHAALLLRLVEGQA